MNRTAVSGSVVADRRRTVTERRAFRRMPFVAAVKHELPHSSVGWLLGQAANLGLTGMQVRRQGDPHEQPLPTHTQVQVFFELPDGGHMLALQAEVVFDRAAPQTQRFTTGLRFAPLSDEIADRLRSFLNQLR